MQLRLDLAAPDLVIEFRVSKFVRIRMKRFEFARSYAIPREFVDRGEAAYVRGFEFGDAIDQPGVRVVVNPGGTNAQFDKSSLHRATVIEYPGFYIDFSGSTAGAGPLKFYPQVIRGKCSAPSRWMACLDWNCFVIRL